VIPMNCLHASRQRWSAPSQVNIIDGSSYRILKRSNLQVCQVVDATHGHRHCDYYTIVKVMGGVRPRTVKPRTEWPVALRIPSQTKGSLRGQGDVGDKPGDGDRGEIVVQSVA
jgi:hypothetical protein